MEAYQNAALSPEERAKDLLGKMTLQEKVGQLNQRLYGFRIYERQGEEFTLTEEFKEEVERMGGLGVLYGLYRADPWADKDEKTGIVLELSAKAYNIVQKYVIDHSRLGIPMMMSTECPHGHQALGGGLIPTYLVIQRLQMLNTIWALILPGCLSVYNMIVARTFFKSNISEELYEAAEIDGCTQARFFFQIALPLSKAIIAILVLYYGVGHWNSYFSALVYISDKAKYPLQLVLRNILITNQTALSQTATTAAARAALQEKQQLIDVMKYSLIIISSIPVLVMYPLVQKHFVKGVMIGSMKG